MNNTYKEDFKVYTWDADNKDKLKLKAVFDYCQEAAGQHASILGFGKDDLQKSNLVWILSRMTAVVYKRPKWGTVLHTETWPRGSEHVFAMRNYKITNDNNDIIAEARSAWLICDLESRRPVRPDTIASKMPQNEGLDLLPDGAPAIKFHDVMQKIAERQVSYADLDYNGHMNNARYVEWIEDLINPEELSNANSIKLDINYIAEQKPGTSTELRLAKLETLPEWANRYAIEGINNAGMSSFRAILSLN